MGKATERFGDGSAFKMKKSLTSRLKGRVVLLGFIQLFCGGVITICALLVGYQYYWTLLSNYKKCGLTPKVLLYMTGITTLIAGCLALISYICWPSLQDRVNRLNNVSLAHFAITTGGWLLNVWMIIAYAVAVSDYSFERLSEMKTVGAVMVFSGIANVILFFANPIILRKEMLLREKLLLKDIQQQAERSLEAQDFPRSLTSPVPSGDASAPHPAAPHESPPVGYDEHAHVVEAFGLQFDHTLDPVTFRQLWQATPESGQFACEVGRVPSGEMIAQHMIRQGFQVVSSTYEGDEAVCMFYGLQQPSYGKVATGGAMLLGEFRFSMKRNIMKAVFKCDDPSKTALFVQLFHLQDLITVIREL